MAPSLCCSVIGFAGRKQLALAWSNRLLRV
jgi:hypothetical protein